MTDEEDGRLQEGWTPGEKAMTPLTDEQRPTQPPPKPSDIVKPAAAPADDA